MDDVTSPVDVFLSKVLCFVNVFCFHQQLIYVLEPGPDLKRVARLLALFCIPSRLKAVATTNTLYNDALQWNHAVKNLHVSSCPGNSH